jgi:hypothetical protein
MCIPPAPARVIQAGVLFAARLHTMVSQARAAVKRPLDAWDSAAL